MGNILRTVLIVFFRKAIKEKWNEILELAMKYEKENYKLVYEKAKREAIDVLSEGVLV